MRIVIAQIGASGGRAEILPGLLGALGAAFGAIEPTVFDPQPERTKSLYPDLDVRQLMWLQFRTGAGRAAVRGAAKLVASEDISAATLLTGEATVRDLKTYADADLNVCVARGADLAARDPLSFELDVLRHFDAPLVVVSVSASPFEQSEHRRIIELGERATLVLTDDDRTLQHFAESGVPRGKLQVCPALSAWDGGGDPDPEALRAEQRAGTSELRHLAALLAERFAELQL